MMSWTSEGEMVCRKKARVCKADGDPFDRLPDDIVSVILGKLSSSADSPPDFINALLTYVSLSLPLYLSLSPSPVSLSLLYLSFSPSLSLSLSFSLLSLSLSVYLSVLYVHIFGVS